MSDKKTKSVATKSIPDDPGKRLVINVDDRGEYTIMGVKFDKTSLKHRLKAQGQLTTTEFMGMTISDEKVMLRADKFTPYKHIQDVYFMLGEATIWKVCFATLKDG